MLNVYHTNIFLKNNEIRNFLLFKYNCIYNLCLKYKEHKPEDVPTQFLIFLLPKLNDARDFFDKNHLNVEQWDEFRNLNEEIIQREIFFFKKLFDGKTKFSESVVLEHIKAFISALPEDENNVLWKKYKSEIQSVFLHIVQLTNPHPKSRIKPILTEDQVINLLSRCKNLYLGLRARLRKEEKEITDEMVSEYFTHEKEFKSNNMLFLYNKNACVSVDSQKESKGEFKGLPAAGGRFENASRLQGVKQAIAPLVSQGNVSVHVVSETKTPKGLEWVTDDDLLRFYRQTEKLSRILNVPIPIDVIDPYRQDFRGETYYSDATTMQALNATAFAVERILKTESPTFSICGTRPPGHHACQNHGHGFCPCNKTLFGAVKALEAGKKVLIVDIDLHYCDGTVQGLKKLLEEKPEWRGQIRLVDVHGGIWPVDPKSDEVILGELDDVVKSAEMPRGSKEKNITEMLCRQIDELDFDPDVIFWDLGFDGHEAEIIDQGKNFWKLTSEDYEKIIATVYKHILANMRERDPENFVPPSSHGELQGGYHKQMPEAIKCVTSAFVKMMKLAKKSRAEIVQDLKATQVESKSGRPVRPPSGRRIDIFAENKSTNKAESKSDAQKRASFKKGS